MSTDLTENDRALVAMYLLAKPYAEVTDAQLRLAAKGGRDGVVTINIHPEIAAAILVYRGDGK